VILTVLNSLVKTILVIVFANAIGALEIFTAQCTLVHLRVLGIACHLSVRPFVCNVVDL